VRFRGALCRALNPIWARDPLSGEGARRHGGRFNPRGLPALYTSLSVVAAIREAHQVGSLQPTLLVSYEADLAPVFDATDPDALARHGMTAAELADDGWRIPMIARGRAPTQAFSERLIADGHAGMLAPSFARGATAADRNLVLWKWGPDLPARLVLVDDEQRLR